jgi:hypothetical protein
MARAPRRPPRRRLAGPAQPRSMPAPPSTAPDGHRQAARRTRRPRNSGGVLPRYTARPRGAAVEAGGAAAAGAGGGGGPGPGPGRGASERRRRPLGLGRGGAIVGNVGWWEGRGSRKKAGGEGGGARRGAPLAQAWAYRRVHSRAAAAGRIWGAGAGRAGVRGGAGRGGAARGLEAAPGGAAAAPGPAAPPPGAPRRPRFARGAARRSCSRTAQGRPTGAALGLVPPPHPCRSPPARCPSSAWLRSPRGGRPGWGRS